MFRPFPRPHRLWLPLLLVIASLGLVAQASASHDQGAPGQPPPEGQPPPGDHPPGGGDRCRFDPRPGGPGGDHGDRKPPERAGASFGGDRRPGSGRPDGEDRCEPPDFKRGFLNRVWKFLAEVDAYNEQDRVLETTLQRIINLPKRFRRQDDELIDQDMYARLGKRTRVYDKTHRRIRRIQRRKVDQALDDAERVRVHGKLLRPRRWLKDEDDMLVPTVRAKKIYILE